MAIGSTAPWIAQEKNVWARLRATISALDIVLADSTAMTRAPARWRRMAPIVADAETSSGRRSRARRRLPFRRCDSPIPVATRRLPEAVGGPDGLRARLRGDPHGRAAGRVARPGRRTPPDGAPRRRRQPGRPARRVPRRGLRRPSTAAAAPDRLGRGPRVRPVLDPARLFARRAPDRAALHRAVRWVLPWCALHGS